MSFTDQVCRIQFIPKNQDTFRSKNVKNTIAQYLNMNEFTIGSSKEASIIYKIKGIHPVHLRVMVKGRELFVEDVFSKTGVTINGKRIKAGEKIPYRSGEFIRLGNSPDIITVELFKKPIDSRLESQEVVREAEKKAQEIVREAEKQAGGIAHEASGKMHEASLADEKSEALIGAAKEKAEEVLSKRKKELELLYEEKVRSAIQEGQERADETSRTILESAQKEVHLLLMNARNEAEDILSQGAVKREEALREKDDILKENENLLARKKDLEKHVEDVLAENDDVSRKNTELIDKAKQIEDQYQVVEQEFKSFKEEMDKNRSIALEEVAKIEEEHAQFNLEMEESQRLSKEARKETDLQKSKTSEVIAERDQLQSEIQRLHLDIQETNEVKELAIVDADRVKNEARKEVENIKEAFENEYEKRKEKAVKRFKAISDRERERLPGMIKELTTEIIEELAFDLSGLNSQTHRLFIEKAVSKVVIEEYELREKTMVELPKEGSTLKVRKKRKFQFQKSMGLSLMGLAAFVGFFIYKGQVGSDKKPVVVAALQKRKIQSVAKKKSTPPKSIPLDRWRESYTENLLFTKNYLKFTKNQKTNKLLKAELESFMMADLKLDKDAIVKFKVQEGMLIWELKKIRNKIKPSQKKKRLAEMKKKEIEMKKPLLAILGGRKNFNQYFKFQRQQFLGK